MSKYDIVPKINFKDLIDASFVNKKIDHQQAFYDYLNTNRNFQLTYFNWGRNALYYFFKSLNYEDIAFPGFTCPTLIEAAEKAGKKVTLVEVDINTFNIDLNKIPKNTKCLFVVHTFGNPVDMAKIRIKFPNIFIIEDCAHALFSQINNGLAGHGGDAVLFSLYKQIANINGAILLTSDKFITTQKQEPLYLNLKRLIIKTQGFHQYLLDLKRQQYLPGIEKQLLNTHKPNELVMNLFYNKLKSLKKEIDLKRQIAAFYYQELKKSKYLIAQQVEVNSNPSFYNFAVRLQPKISHLTNKLIMFLRKENIFIANLWPDAPIVSPRYKSFQNLCPNALWLAKSVINLPIYSKFKESDVVYLFNKINQAINTLKNEN